MNTPEGVNVVLAFLERRLSHYSLKGKIVTIFTLAGFVVAVGAVVLLLVFEGTFTKRALENEYRATVAVAVRSVSVAVDFNDSRDAEEILMRFDGSDGIVYSEIRFADGRVLGSYGVVPEFRSVKADDQEHVRISYMSAMIEVIAPIDSIDDGSPVAHIYMVGDLGELYQTLAIKIVSFGFILLLGGVGILMFALRLSRLITSPIQDLAETAHRISRDHDFSQRQTKLHDDETGKLVDAFNEMMDELEARDDTIRSNEERFREYFELGIVGMSVLDHNGRILEYNTELCTMLESSSEQIAHSSFDDWVTDEGGGEVRTSFVKLKNACDPGYSGEYWLKRKDGSLLYTIVSARQLRPDRDSNSLYLVLLQDITDRKHSEEELIASKRAAEDANRSKDEFLSVMSHELRTPLNPIIGFVDLLLRLDEDEERKQMLQSIRRSSEHLLTLINDILEFTRAQAGRLVAVNESFNLKEHCENTIEMLCQSGAGKGVQIQLRNMDLSALNDDSMLVSDPGKIRQVVLNLLSNGIKYNILGGRVWMDVVVFRQEGGELILRIDVEDTGIGIEKSKLECIFEPFTQLDMSLQRKHEGVGLGLSICKRIVECMDGKLFVHSEENKGSVFSFEVQVGEFDPESERTVVNSDPDAEVLDSLVGNRRILLVEDDINNKQMIEAVLDKIGIAYDWAVNGLVALERLETSQFDLVLMDVGMPVMDGLEATQEIRHREEEKGGHTPIVAITAHASAEMQKKCVTAGMDAYLTKPINSEKLRSCILKYI